MVAAPVKNAVQPARLLGQMELLCDTVRLRLLRLVEQHELGVAELCDIIQLPQSTVSRHLKLLSEQGWVVHRRSGTTNLYRMIADELDRTGHELWQLASKQIAGTASDKQDQLRLMRRLRLRRKDAKTFFAGAAGQWDSLRADLYGRSFTTAAMIALLPSHWTVADLGCGTGIMAEGLSPYVAKVIGVDQSEAMLEAARQRTAGLENVELRQGDLEALPMENDESDATILSIVLTYVADPSAIVRQAARATRPGGKVVVVDLLRHDREDFRRQMGQQWPGFDTHELERMLTDAGLHSPGCQTLPPETGAKGPALVLATAVGPDVASTISRNGR